ncbi:MAG: hypothetical protein A2977_01180 [Alphaproteobacteria bacterium RIFCSPLOWO2_01_FULL_45_8]|nr:MAG: hypothetical protein A3K20_01070 [Alphaproteobacteria bacterium GWA1_45_9]OFW89829.1 MAG: hypothetical protein A2621_02955 [Alphaproteobacteria bacterium RIFCSPHIGHO2_01_FULL_41_14]OFW96093.1 MAG: hypothetical protein A2977_01180 [Alphaproteobacteria bacterium RIFCSPLOWO2_01_FULL_45_8]HCI48961.1 hypothetical protein [Holosporales bacterium]
MRMIFFLCITLSFLFCNASASTHCSECPDAAFIALGQQYRSVGAFISKTGICGSGTLVDLGPPSLRGKAVLTCAHIFETSPEELSHISFQLDDHLITGKAFIHPRYLEVSRDKSPETIDYTCYDLGLFLLDCPLLDIPLAPVRFAPVEQLINKVYASVGYGDTGHLLGNYLLRDGKKRGSYAWALPEINFSAETECTTIMLERDGITKTLNQRVRTLPNHILFLTPFQPDITVYKTPAGVAGNGDSGGPAFDEQGNCIGIISGGNQAPELDEDKKQYLIEETYFGQYPKLSQDFEKSAQINPQFIPPKIIPTRGLESYFVPSNPPLPHYLKCDIILATLFPHKDWIESMIGKRQS